MKIKSKVVYQVCRKLNEREKRLSGGCKEGVYAGYFTSKKDAEEFAKKVGGWIEKILIED